jgi:GT2 family glycosyltransferase
VDNNSIDDSLAIIAQYFPEAKVICNANNLGYCRAHNQAIACSRGVYYLPLNPDVHMDPGYIGSLVEVIEQDPQFGSAAGKLIQPGGQPGNQKIDSTGLFVDRRRRQYLRGHDQIDRRQFDRNDEVFGVDGAAPLYRRSMLEDIRNGEEYFDESFFAHKEDVDLAWRARWFGWGCVYTSDAVATHRRSFRPGKREPIPNAVRIHAVKNRYLLLLKNESMQGLRRDGLSILWYDLKIFGYLCLFERSSLSALNLVRQHWKRTTEWREDLIRRRKCSPEQMLTWFNDIPSPSNIEPIP